MSIEDRLEFKSDLCAVKAEVRAGVNEEHAQKRIVIGLFGKITGPKTNLDPFLINIKDPIPYLEIFGKRLRNG